MDAFTYQIMKHCGILGTYGAEPDPLVIISACVQRGAYQLALMYVDYLVSGKRLMISPLELVPPALMGKIESVCVVSAKAMTLSGVEIETSTTHREITVNDTTTQRQYKLLEPDSFAVLVKYRDYADKENVRAFIFRNTTAGQTITLADDTTTQILASICKKELSVEDFMYTSEELETLKKLGYAEEVVGDNK